MVNKKTKPLPKWARLIQPSSPSSSSSSVDREDAFLRTKAYHAVAESMNRAFSRALLDTSSPMFYQELNGLLAKVKQTSTNANKEEQELQAQADEVEEERVPKKQRSSSSTDNHSGDCDAPSSTSTTRSSDHDHDHDHVDTNEVQTTSEPTASAVVSTASLLTSGSSKQFFTLQPPVHYDPLLLPLLILDGPFWHTDRAAWMAHLVHSAKQSRPRSCTVWLRPTPCQLRSGARGCYYSYKEELMRQCLAQEPDPTIFAGSRRRRRNQRFLRNYTTTTSSSSSVTDALLLWAARTRAFDEILVFLEVEHGDSLYNNNNNNSNSSTANAAEQLADFLAWAAERRALHGLPLSIVFMGPQRSFRRPIQLMRSIGGGGLLVRRVELPSPKAVLEAFWVHFSKEGCCPGVLLHPSTLSTLRHVYQNQNRSAVHILYQLQQAVALQFSLPGSFLSAVQLLASPQQQQSKRITSLIFHKQFQSLVASNSSNSTLASCTSTSLLTWLEDCESRRRLACSVALPLHKLLNDKYSESSEPFLLHPMNSAQKFDKALNEEDRRALIAAAAANLRSESSQAATESAFSHLDLLPGDKLPHETLIREKTADAINELIVLFDQCTTVSEVIKCLEPLTDAWVTKSPSPLDNPLLLPSSQDEKVCSPPLPRRDHVNAMLEDLECVGDDRSVIVPGCMYRLILDRASISETDWFNSFVETYQHPAGTDATSRTMLFHLFGCGVRHLQICGLIRDRRVTGKSGTTYEKTALVWCGGD